MTADSRALVNPIDRSVSAGAFPPVRAGHLNRPVHAMRRRVVPPRFLGTPPGKISHRRPDKIKVSHYRHMAADLYLYSVQVSDYPADSRAFVNPIYRSVSAGAFPPVRAGHLNRPVHAMRRRVVPPRFLGTPPGKISHRRPDKIKVSHFRHMTADLYSVQV